MGKYCVKCSRCVLKKENAKNFPYCPVCNPLGIRPRKRLRNGLLIMPENAMLEDKEDLELEEDTEEAVCKRSCNTTFMEI